MAAIGRNMKWLVDRALREQVRAFFVEGLGASQPAGPPHIDLYKLGDGFQIGVFSVDPAEAVRPEDQRKAAWLEFIVGDIEGTIKKLGELGVQEIEYVDKEHRYFQAPGGPVFRLASER